MKISLAATILGVTLVVSSAAFAVDTVQTKAEALAAFRNIAFRNIDEPANNPPAPGLGFFGIAPVFTPPKVTGTPIGSNLQQTELLTFEEGSLLEGVTLFGQVGTGIALPPDQCEDVKDPDAKDSDCAPSTAFRILHQDVINPWLDFSLEAVDHQTNLVW